MDAVQALFFKSQVINATLHKEFEDVFIGHEIAFFNIIFQ